MFEALKLLLDSLVFYTAFSLVATLYTLYLNLASHFWWAQMAESSARPQVFFQRGSKFMEFMVERCSTLKQG